MKLRAQTQAQIIAETLDANFSIYLSPDVIGSSRLNARGWKVKLDNVSVSKKGSISWMNPRLLMGASPSPVEAIRTAWNVVTENYVRIGSRTLEWDEKSFKFVEVSIDESKYESKPSPEMEYPKNSTPGIVPFDEDGTEYWESIERCHVASPKPGWVCSLHKHHKGNHQAHSGHNLKTFPSQVWSAEQCEEVAPHSPYYVCSLHAGHKGSHEAWEFYPPSPEQEQLDEWEQ